MLHNSVSSLTTTMLYHAFLCDADNTAGMNLSTHMVFIHNSELILL